MALRKMVSLLAAGTALSGAWSVQAQAQEAAAATASTSAATAAPASDSTASTNGGVEEIVVTAQRRAENLQDIPISIQSISAAQLADRGSVSAADLASVVPGLVFPRSIGGGAPYLRGDGNVTIVGGENAVAFYIDGVFLQRTSSNLMSFNNIERIEVLKGPQGTLFGRNAVGGLIHVITRDPTQEKQIDVSFGYGAYNDLTGNFFATGGLSDNISASIALTGERRDSGYGFNVGTGHKLFDTQSFGAQNKFKFEDSSGRFTLLTNVILNTQETDDGAVIAIVPGTDSPGHLLHNIGRHTINNPAFDPGTESTQIIASAKASYDFGWGVVSDQLAYEHSKMSLQMNLTPAPVILSAAVAPLFYYLTGTDHTWTNELQFQSKAGSRLQWVLGGFYMSNADSNDNSLYGANVGIGKYPGLT
jgi:iron complex outermembrane receptor protein